MLIYGHQNEEQLTVLPMVKQRVVFVVPPFMDVQVYVLPIQ